MGKTLTFVSSLFALAGLSVFSGVVTTNVLTGGFSTVSGVTDLGRVSGMVCVEVGVARELEFALAVLPATQVTAQGTSTCVQGVISGQYQACA